MTCRTADGAGGGDGRRRDRDPRRYRRVGGRAAQRRAHARAAGQARRSTSRSRRSGTAAMSRRSSSSSTASRSPSLEGDGIDPGFKRTSFYACACSSRGTAHGWPIVIAVAYAVLRRRRRCRRPGLALRSERHGRTARADRREIVAGPAAPPSWPACRPRPPPRRAPPMGRSSRSPGRPVRARFRDHRARPARVARRVDPQRGSAPLEVAIGAPGGPFTAPAEASIAPGADGDVRGGVPIADAPRGGGRAATLTSNAQQVETLRRSTSTAPSPTRSSR